MKYTRLYAMALVALLMAGTAEAQVSVRRQNRDKTESTGTTARQRNEGTSAKGKDASAAVAPARRASEGSAAAAGAGKGAAVKTSTKPTTTKKSGTAKTDDKATVQANGKTVRRNSFDEYQKESQEETPWQHVVYREIDLTVEQNASLYYPVEPEDGLTNLFRVMLGAFAKNELKAYEYLGDRESFTEKYEAKPMDVLDKYEVPYRVEQPKGSTKEIYVIDDIDVPSNEVLSYYVKERWEFDQKRSRFVPRILAICPVLHRSGEGGDGKAKYPVFWVNFEDLRPLLRNHLIVSPGMNHAARYSMEEFFTLYQYEGTIYKEQNLRGLTLAQQYPNPDSLKMRQKEIDEQLRGFGKQVWVTDEPEEETPAADKKSKRAKKEAATTDAQTEETEEHKLVKTGRRNRRTKEEVVVDSTAIVANATKHRSVRR